jgi:hypothetical protein
MGESLLSGPSGNVPPEMIKMHTHTTLITHTTFFCINCELGRRKNKEEEEEEEFPPI